MRSLIALCSRFFYYLLTLVGRERRFALALRLAAPLEWALRLTGRHRKPPFSLDTDREHALALLLNVMTFRGVEFDPVLRVDGAENLPAGAGTLLLSGHFYLNFVFLRWLYDRRIPLSSVMVTERAEWCYSGTRVAFETIPPTRRTLFEIAERINAGRTIVAAIDNCVPYEGWRRVRTDRREIYTSENIVRFAVKKGIPIAFFATGLAADGRLVTEIRRPTAATPEGIFEEFDQFLDSQLEKREK